jgi:hypothetical protein
MTRIGITLAVIDPAVSGAAKVGAGVAISVFAAASLIAYPSRRLHW